MQIKKLSNLIKLCETNQLNYFEYTKGNKTIVFLKDHANNNPDGISENTLDIDTLSKTAIKSNGVHPDKKQPTCDTLSVCSQLIGLATINEQFADSAPGSRVLKGDVLCTICAMKVYTDVVSPADGILKEVLFKNNQMVECGQELFKIQVAE